MGEFFEELGEGMREFQSNNIGGRKLWGNILQKFGEGMSEHQKNKMDRRKLIPFPE